MFKRANKITSLLVAAASVATMVPAYAADVKKVDSQDGTVYNAVAYKDGTAYIDAEVNDSDAGYYYKGGKFTELDNVDSGSEVAAFGSKYAKIDDGKDYNVDLESGKVLDSDVPGDTEDDAASALRKEVKDGDRYEVSTTSGSGYGATFNRSDIAALSVIPGAKFTDNWYSTKLYVKAGQFVNDYTNETTVFTDMKGNFIDADYNLGKIKVQTTLTGATTTTSASVTIENTKDKYKLRNSDDTWATVDGGTILGQDKDYIYRTAEITVHVSNPGTSDIVEINGMKYFVNGSNNVVLPVIQKISKKQDSGSVDDGKYAATVYNYVISNDSGDQADTNTKAANYAGLANGGQAQVVGGKLVIFKVLNQATVSGGDTVTLQAATLKQKNGYYYTDIEDSANITPEFSSKTNKTAIDTDVDGNIYVLDGGYIKKFDGTDDWTKIYKVDGSFDAISAYDKDNMVAWSQADEVYSVIGGKSADDTKKDDTTTPATTVTAGWAKNTDGSWTFNKADGTKATGWYTDTTGTWYYSNANGIMLANAWAQDSVGAWYYLGGSGAMTVNAWVQSGGKYYYVGATGAMLANTTTPDGYWVGADGAWV